MNLESEFLRRAGEDADPLNASTWRLAAALLATSGITSLVERIASWSEYGDSPDVDDMRTVVNWAIREARAAVESPVSLPLESNADLDEPLGPACRVEDPECESCQ